MKDHRAKQCFARRSFIFVDTILEVRKTRIRHTLSRNSPFYL